MRLLRRASYKDPNAALKMIDLRDSARERGVDMGGVRRSEDNARNAQAYSQNMERMAADREQEEGMNRGMAGRAGGGLGNGAAGGGLGNGAAGGGLGNGRSGGSTAPRLSFAEQDRITREERFGKVSPTGGLSGGRSQNSGQEASSLVDSVLSQSIGGSAAGGVTAYTTADEDKIKASLGRVKELGGTEESFRGAIANRIGATPQTTAARVPEAELPPLKDSPVAPSVSPDLSDILLGLRKLEDPTIEGGKAADANNTENALAQSVYDRDAAAKRLEEIKKRNAEGKPAYNRPTS